MPGARFWPCGMPCSGLFEVFLGLYRLDRSLFILVPSSFQAIEDPLGLVVDRDQHSALRDLAPHLLEL